MNDDLDPTIPTILSSRKRRMEETMPDCDAPEGKHGCRMTTEGRTNACSSPDRCRARVEPLRGDNRSDERSRGDYPYTTSSTATTTTQPYPPPPFYHLGADVGPPPPYNARPSSSCSLLQEEKPHPYSQFTPPPPGWMDANQYHSNAPGGGFPFPPPPQAQAHQQQPPPEQMRQLWNFWYASYYYYSSHGRNPMYPVPPPWLTAAAGPPPPYPPPLPVTNNHHHPKTSSFSSSLFAGENSHANSSILPSVSQDPDEENNKHLDSSAGRPNGEKNNKRNNNKTSSTSSHLSQAIWRLPTQEECPKGAPPPPPAMPIYHSSLLLVNSPIRPSVSDDDDHEDEQQEPQERPSAGGTAERPSQENEQHPSTTTTTMAPPRQGVTPTELLQAPPQVQRLQEPGLPKLSVGGASPFPVMEEEEQKQQQDSPHPTAFLWDSVLRSVSKDQEEAAAATAGHPKPQMMLQPIWHCAAAPPALPQAPLQQGNRSGSAAFAFCSPPAAAAWMDSSQAVLASVSTDSNEEQDSPPQGQVQEEESMTASHFWHSPLRKSHELGQDHPKNSDDGAPPASNGYPLSSTTTNNNNNNHCSWILPSVSDDQEEQPQQPPPKVYDSPSKHSTMTEPLRSPSIWRSPAAAPPQPPPQGHEVPRDSQQGSSTKHNSSSSSSLNRGQILWSVSSSDPEDSSDLEPASPSIWRSPVLPRPPVPREARTIQDDHPTMPSRTAVPETHEWPRSQPMFLSAFSGCSSQPIPPCALNSARDEEEEGQSSGPSFRSNDVGMHLAVSSRGKEDTQPEHLDDWRGGNNHRDILASPSSPDSRSNSYLCGFLSDMDSEDEEDLPTAQALLDWHGVQGGIASPLRPCAAKAPSGSGHPMWFSPIQQVDPQPGDGGEMPKDMPPPPPTTTKKESVSVTNQATEPSTLPQGLLATKAMPPHAPRKGRSLSLQDFLELASLAVGQEQQPQATAVAAPTIAPRPYTMALQSSSFGGSLQLPIIPISVRRSVSNEQEEQYSFSSNDVDAVPKASQERLAFAASMGRHGSSSICDQQQQPRAEEVAVRYQQQQPRAEEECQVAVRRQENAACDNYLSSRAMTFASSMRGSSSVSGARNECQAIPVTNNSQQYEVPNVLNPGLGSLLCASAPPPSFKAYGGIPLSIPSDVEHLSKYHCLVRAQIDLFAAGEAEHQSNMQGRNRPIVRNQVGLRCRHCAGISPPNRRPPGSVYYPSKLSGLYQAAVNMAKNHFMVSCQRIPSDVKTELVQLKEKKTYMLGGGKGYWSTGGRIRRLVEVDNRLFFDSSVAGLAESEYRKAD
ncbi:hypothetical protein ACA910_015374 [Epithemia clementina (nom. ined.)]